jgi:hypothetical protein
MKPAKLPAPLMMLLRSLPISAALSRAVTSMSPVMTTSIIFLIGNYVTNLSKVTEIDFEEGQQQDDAVVGMQGFNTITLINDVTDVFVVFNIKAEALSQIND